MLENNFNIQGLTDEQVVKSRAQYGFNRLSFKRENGFIKAIKSLLHEPMVILLLVTSSVYFLAHNYRDGIFLASSVVLVAAISLFQDSRSQKALEKLKDFTQPYCKVIRNGKTEQIRSEDLVIGDSLVVEEGKSITADARIVHSNDFSVNEAILTGESLPVFKDKSKENNLIFHGTVVASGLAIATITAIGNETRLGKIGKSLEEINQQATPLELQINSFVKKMVIAGAIVFVIVWGLNFLHSHNLLDSLIRALTLAMSILPEEIPVAFTTFMALGAWRLMKIGVIVKQIKTVETLGSASVICTDKTGTLTESKMSLAKVFAFSANRVFDVNNALDDAGKALIRTAMFASEPIPFDPMETALHEAYLKTAISDERAAYTMIHEYPISGKPPMMTHLFESKGRRIIAAKGAPEALIAVSNLNLTERKRIEENVKMLAADGYRVLGVGEANFSGDVFPASQQEFHFGFKGLVAFYDPPKKNIASVLANFYKAGIAVKIVTGDNAETTRSIARQIHFKGIDRAISGEALMKLDERELQDKAESVAIFTRMFPDAKLKVINALKTKNEIVAMTGDGVNDGPALKAADIGIAMGKKGTEIAKDAASLILLEDDLSKMVDAIAMGRRIYANLKKAIQYILSIHIPIVLTVFIPLTLGWIYPNIFSPVHIIFFELIMGPTCSIIYENEPIEKNLMLQKPRPFTTTFFNWKELATSILQGLVIAAGALSIYRFAVSEGFHEQVTRTMVFSTLITANIFLTLVNRSFYYSLLTTIKYKNNLVLLIICITIALSGLLLFVKPLAMFFGFKTLSFRQLAISIAIGCMSVLWYEIVKLWKRLRPEKGK